MAYPAPRWLIGGHLQTLYPALFIKPSLPPLYRERWDTPDHDFVDVDFSPDRDSNSPIVILFHGLEGSSQSHYARALLAHLDCKSWLGIVPHFRGCSGELNRAPRFYHSGDSAEINWIIRRIAARYPTRPLFVCGVSLGGNALLRWLGEQQDDAKIVRAACSVSAPLDLSAGGAALSQGFNRIYTQNFLQTLKPKCLKKLAQYPDLFSREAMLNARNLYEFDNVVTAPLHGYRDTDDYWERASAKHILPDICVPTWILNAQNDPFLPARALPKHASPWVKLEYPREGGHVGFASGNFPGNINWLPQQLTDFFQCHG